jgi:hypothetical protein
MSLNFNSLAIAWRIVPYYSVASVTNAKFFIEVALGKQGIKADFSFNTL